ncbi:unnamed protein product [Cuscuta campestris]|uniref:Uncharacterized protein n=1 Tax=Cuscuta campestris TaxID=132261 RepID=A0A484LBN7_9ASTE|nr:unnamed protein product [Cuscuta campestris]
MNPLHPQGFLVRGNIPQVLAQKCLIPDYGLIQTKPPFILGLADILPSNLTELTPPKESSTKGGYPIQDRFMNRESLEPEAFNSLDNRSDEFQSSCSRQGFGIPFSNMFIHLIHKWGKVSFRSSL